MEACPYRRKSVCCLLAADWEGWEDPAGCGLVGEPSPPVRRPPDGGRNLTVILSQTIFIMLLHMFIHL